MSKKKICIDPGHGGTDSGAVGQNGAKEKDIVLQIGLKLRGALQRNGIAVVMTREKDIESGNLVIADRCKIANSASVDYLVSIHANADGDRDDKTGHGTETWAYSTSSSGYPLAQAVQKLFGDTGTRIIGTRHGEKLYETLMTQEERLRAEDMGNYYRVAADNRDLNYDKFVVKGEVHTMADEAYTSHNTRRLNVEQTVEKILTTDYVREQLAGWSKG